MKAKRACLPVWTRVAGICVLACVTLGGAALADGRGADALAAPKNLLARDYQKRGNALYRSREFAAAADAYKQGLAVENAPVFAYNLGQCFRHLGKYEDAIWHFERFLGSAPPRERREIVERLISEMRSELEQRARTSPPTEPAGDDSDGSDKDAVRTATPFQLAKAPTSQTDARWYQDGIAWGLTGSGAALGAASMALLFSAKSLDADANQERDQVRQNDLHDSASGRRLTGVVVGATAGALLLAGIVKLVSHDTNAGARDGRRVSLDVTAGGVVGRVLF